MIYHPIRPTVGPMEHRASKNTSARGASRSGVSRPKVMQSSSAAWGQQDDIQGWWVDGGFSGGFSGGE